MTTEAPPFDAIPLGSLEREPLPLDARRNSRVLSSDPRNVAARKRRASKPKGAPKRRTTTARRKPVSLAPEIGALLALVNGAIIASPLGTRPVQAITDPNIAAERIGDELDGAEIAALASAIDAQCKRSPRFRKVVEGFLGAGSGGTLIAVVGLIAVRRMARHGVLPPHLDFTAGMVLSADVGALADMADAAVETTDPDTGETVPDRSADDGEV